LNPTTQNAFFEMRFCPNVELISVVRRFISGACDRFYGDADSSARIALAAHELLENAVRYADDDITSVRVEFAQRSGASGGVTIITKNRASAANAQRMQDLVEEIAHAPNPMRLYVTKMRATAGVAEGSGLGLARVRAESDMTITYQREGDTVVISAHGDVAPETQDAAEVARG
jgi:hypothetical protein